MLKYSNTVGGCIAAADGRHRAPSLGFEPAQPNRYFNCDSLRHSPTGKRAARAARRHNHCHTGVRRFEKTHAVRELRTSTSNSTPAVRAPFTMGALATGLLVVLYGAPWRPRPRTCPFPGPPRAPRWSGWFAEGGRWFTDGGGWHADGSGWCHNGADACVRARACGCGRARGPLRLRVRLRVPAPA